VVVGCLPFVCVLWWSVVECGGVRVQWVRWSTGNGGGSDGGVVNVVEGVEDCGGEVEVCGVSQDYGALGLRIMGR